MRLHPQPRLVARGLGQCRVQVDAQRLKLRFGLRLGPARCESPDQPVVLVPQIRVGTERRPRFRLVERPEVGWHDADDRVRLAAQPHSPSDDAWVAREVTGPDAVAEHDGGGSHLVAPQEGAPQTGCNAQNLEVAGGDLEVPDVGGALFADQVDSGAQADAGEGRERVAVVAQERDISLRVESSKASEPRVVAQHAHDPIRLREGQGPDEDGVDHAEHRDCGAESESEDHHRRDREPGILRERAAADPEVLPQIRDELPPPPLPLPPLVDLDARRLDPRIVAKAPRGLRPGLRRITTFPHEPFDELANVEVELGIDVRAHVGAPEPQIPPPHGCSRHPRTSAMQPARPAAPCRRPRRTPSSPRSRSSAGRGRGT